MTITKEQLELAAKAAGIEHTDVTISHSGNPTGFWRNFVDPWTPLTDHGQLLDLAMACGMELDFDGDVVKSWVRDYESTWHVYKFPFVRGDFPSLAEAVITAAADQQLAKETKE